MSAFHILNAFSAVSFLAFGISCLISNYMVREFERYRLAGYRKLVGYLEISGGVGLTLGFMVPLIGGLAAAGLTLLMLMGVVVRIRIKDGPIKSSPALAYLLVNLYLLMEFFRALNIEG